MLTLEEKLVLAVLTIEIWEWNTLAGYLDTHIEEHQMLGDPVEDLEELKGKVDNLIERRHEFLLDMGVEE